MLVTDDGIVTDVSPLQPANAFCPMLVTEGGIVTSTSPLQPQNARSPILVTDDGIVTSPFTPAMRICPPFEQSKPLIEQYVLFAGSTMNDIILLHPVNANDPMLVTLEGIDTDLSPEQPLNANDPILVTPDGIDTDLRALHDANA